MKQKKGFKLRNVCGEHVVVAEGIENIDFSKIISMNESSAYLWEKIAGREFTAEDLSELLLEEYDVDAIPIVDTDGEPLGILEKSTVDHYLHTRIIELNRKLEELDD